MDIIERRIKEQEKVIDRSRNFAQNLPLNSSAFLVGSYARGDFNLWSDVDIVVISNFVGNPLVRLKNMDFPPGFEIIPLTPDEFWQMIAKKNPLCMEIKKSGIILRDDLEISRVMSNS